jgi:hypothetical protein
MATVTTNYSWPIPQSTDLVSQGATAIASLGSAIDTTVAAQTSGLVLLDTTTFSAVGSVSVSNKLTATYANYLIEFQGLSSASAQALTLRLRANVTDDSSSNYYYGNVTIASSGAGSSTAKGDPTTSWNIGTSGTNQTGINIHLYSPQISAYTAFTTQSASMDNTNESYTQSGGGAISKTDQFQGFTILVATGTMTGTVRTYGIKN